MFDASRPPAEMPAGYDIAAGYIGGDTPHVWTLTEWGRFSGHYKLPIYVASNDGRDADADAFEALRHLYALGVPLDTRIALDLETRIAPVYVSRFNAVMAFFGYRVWVYGSASTVFRNPVCRAYWVADYAGKGPFMYDHAGVMATQWTNGVHYDSSLVKAFKPERFWK
jgi:hypothetical protein